MKIEDINIDKDSVENFFGDINVEALAKSIEVSGGSNMSNDNKLDSKFAPSLQELDNHFVPSLQERLERIAEDEFELLKQRREVARWLNGSVPVSLSDEEFKWLKARYDALGKVMEALVKQRNVIKAILGKPNVSFNQYSLDTAKLIDKLKNEEFDVHHKVEKLGAFLIDDNRTAKVSDYQLDLLKHQYEVMVEYHRILMNRIFDLRTHHKGENNND